MRFLKSAKEWIVKFLRWLFGPPEPWPEPERPKISLIIPFGGKDKHRKRVLDWLLKYWAHELPDAEIVIGRSTHKPFSKTHAFNDAVRRSRGRVLVLIDADAYMPGSIIERVADRIIDAEDAGERLWFVPYRRLYRLTKAVTLDILQSDPTDPFRPPNPPPPEWIDGPMDHSNYGRRYGAMIMVIPRAAFDLLGGFDKRFKHGWGGEDVALLRALDTLWAKHKSTHNPLFHLHHGRIGDSYRTRAWKDQKSNNPHDKLAQSYHKATRNPGAMRRLVDEGNKDTGRWGRE